VTGASGQNREEGAGRIASGIATTDQQAIARAFGTTTIPKQDRDITNRGFPHQRYKPSKLRPTSTESPDTVTPTVNESRSFPTLQTLSEVQNECGVMGRTGLHERVSMINENENLKEGRPIRHGRGGQVA